MQIIIDWMKVNKMQLNVEKTQMILIGNPGVIKSIGNISIQVGDHTITSVNKIKSLGLTIDSELKWVDHVKLKTREGNSVLWSLWPMQSSISEFNRKLIVNSYIIPIISYMSVIWGTANSSVVKLIESLIRRCGRFVLGSQKYDNVKVDITDKLKWLFPSNIYQFEVLKLAYGIVNKTCPPNFNNYLNIESNLRKTRNREYVNCSHPTTKYGRRCFKYNATLVLPILNNIHCSSTNVKVFNYKLKKYLLDKQLNNAMQQNLSNLECTCDYSCIDDVVNFVYER
jgi:hypothetical protein